jgi:hypothetical protein
LFSFHDEVAGFWITPALLNHSCVANCSRNCFGDIILGRASIFIEKGEELTWAYVNPSVCFDKRKFELNKHFELICDCQLCQEEMNDEKRYEREF